MKHFFLSLAFALALIFFPQNKPSSEESVCFFSNQNHDDLKRGICSFIEGAEKEICIAVFSLSDPSFIKKLNQKAKEGLKISLLVDAKNCWNVKKKLDPNISFIEKKSEGLMHLKVCIVDEKKVWLGSSNLTRESLRMHDNLVAIIDDPKLALFYKKHISALSFDSKRKEYNETYCSNDLKIEAINLPNKKAAEKMTLKMIHSAKKTLDLAIFTFTKLDYAIALVDAQKRGVRVNVFFEKNSAMGSGKKIMRYLLEHRVPLYLSRGPKLLHHKFLFIDGEKLLMGSANWTNAAISKNNDCLLRFEGLSQKQQKSLYSVCKQLKQESKQIF